jgi:group I intron endonuclease
MGSSKNPWIEPKPEFGVIYKITNLVNGKIYIGQTVRQLIRRWHGHCYRARSGKQSHLYEAMRKYGVENFLVEEIDRSIHKEELNAKEVEWISRLGSMDPEVGYNCKEGGNGGRLSEQTKSRMRGRPVPEEMRRRISETLRGRPISKEHHEKMMAARRGTKHSPETIQKMSEGHRRSWTPERRAKASQDRKDRWASGLIKGHPNSEITREKLRNRVISEEHRKRSSEAAKLRYQRQREAAKLEANFGGQIIGTFAPGSSRRTC